jgi:hypothetical protein
VRREGEMEREREMERMGGEERGRVGGEEKIVSFFMLNSCSITTAMRGFTVICAPCTSLIQCKR